MAEEWGEIILKATDNVMGTFIRGDYSNAVIQLVHYTGIDIDSAGDGVATADETILKNGYLYLSYECSEWREISAAIVLNGSAIEYYAAHGDEYGCMSFYALDAEGHRLAFQFDDGSEAFEDEDYQEEIRNKLNQWKAIIPEGIKKFFPEFTDIDADEYIC